MISFINKLFQMKNINELFAKKILLFNYDLLILYLNLVFPLYINLNLYILKVFYIL